MYKYFFLCILCFLTFLGLSGRNYFVSPGGDDKAGDGSNKRPWKSISYACIKIGPGKNNRLLLAAGSYEEERTIILPAGLSIIGDGKETTFITGGSRLYGQGNPFDLVDKNLFFINGSNNKLSGFTIDGQNKQLGGGIYCEKAYKIEIYDLSIRSVHANGIWIQESQDIYTHDVQLYDCSWSSSSWAGGAVHFGKSKDLVFERIQVKEIEQRNGSWGGGLGFKALGGGVLMNVRFSDCEVEVNEYGTWENGKAKNISLEMESVEVDGCIIEHCSFNAAVSLVGNNEQELRGKYDFSVKVAHNKFLNSSGSNALELSLGNALIECNYFDVAKGGYGIKNWENTTQHNWTIRNNIFWMHSAGWPTCVVGSRAGVKQLYFQNNTIHLSGPPTAIIALYGSNSSEGIWVEQNIFLRTNSTPARKEPQKDILVFIRQNEGRHQLDRLTVRKNVFNGFPERIEGPCRQQYISENFYDQPGLKLKGYKPFPYYSNLPGSLAERLEIGANIQ